MLQSGMLVLAPAYSYTGASETGGWRLEAGGWRLEAGGSSRAYQGPIRSQSSQSAVTIHQNVSISPQDKPAKISPRLACSTRLAPTSSGAGSVCEWSGHFLDAGKIILALTKKKCQGSYETRFEQERDPNLLLERASKRASISTIFYFARLVRLPEILGFDLSVHAGAVARRPAERKPFQTGWSISALGGSCG